MARSKNPNYQRPTDHPTMRAAQRVSRILLELPASERRTVLAFVAAMVVSDGDRPAAGPEVVSSFRLHDASTGE